MRSWHAAWAKGKRLELGFRSWERAHTRSNADGLLLPPPVPGRKLMQSTESTSGDGGCRSTPCLPRAAPASITQQGPAGRCCAAPAGSRPRESRGPGCDCVASRGYLGSRCKLRGQYRMRPFRWPVTK